MRVQKRIRKVACRRASSNTSTLTTARLTVLPPAYSSLANDIQGPRPPAAHCYYRQHRHKPNRLHDRQLGIGFKVVCGAVSQRHGWRGQHVAPLDEDREQLLRGKVGRTASQNPEHPEQARQDNSEPNSGDRHFGVAQPRLHSHGGSQREKPIEVSAPSSLSRHLEPQFRCSSNGLRFRQLDGYVEVPRLDIARAKEADGRVCSSLADLGPTPGLRGEFSQRNFANVRFEPHRQQCDQADHGSRLDAFGGVVDRIQSEEERLIFA